MQRFVVYTLVMAAIGCRSKTTWNNAATAECMGASTGADAGPPMGYNERCKACCKQKGLDSVDPGACTCGELGLDGLLR